MRKILLLVLTARGLSAQSTVEIRRAVDRAIPPIGWSARTFVAKRACVSCHHNILPILMFHLARERGVRFDKSALEAVEAKTLRPLVEPSAFEDAVNATTLNDPTPNDSFLLMAAKAAGLAPDAVTAVYARRLVHWQRDGHWVTSDFRPPHSSSYFTATATAVRAIRLYAPEERECIRRARQWLTRARPLSTEDASFRLMGLVWAGAARKEIEEAGRDLVAMRDVSGTWPQLPGYPADAYSTGESLFALQEAGLPAPGGAYRFLISAQASDGTWRVHTRMLSPAKVSPPYFTTGFPYEKDEYLSYAGSVWATMALLAALPEVPAPPPTMRGNAVTVTDVTEPTYEALVAATASRESAASVKRLLDAGAPITKNKPLVFAAMSGDIEVVKLLLGHGAEPSAEALSQAVTFGYPDVVKQLIDAGAPVMMTESSGINLIHWAAIANRPAVIPLLVKAGVPVNAKDNSGFTPLMYAATINFGDRTVFNELIQAGADPDVRNNDGRTATEQAKIFLRSRTSAQPATRAGVVRGQ